MSPPPARWASTSSRGWPHGTASSCASSPATPAARWPRSICPRHGGLAARHQRRCRSAGTSGAARPAPLLGGVPIEEQVRRAVTQSPAPRPVEPSHRTPSLPSRPLSTPPSQSKPPARPVQPVNGLGAGPNGLPTRTPRPHDDAERPPAHSLRAPEPPLPEADSPIFEHVKLGLVPKRWRRRSTGPARPTRAGGEPRPRCEPPRRPRAPVEPSLADAAASGWPRPRRARRRVRAPEPGPRSLRSAPPACRCAAAARPWCPDSIAELAGRGARHPPEATQQDATKVASTLSNLQRGVSRGREATGGWVPKRPDDPERSNP